MILKAGGVLLFFSKAVFFFAMLGVFFIGQNIFYEQTVFYYWGNYVVLLIYAAILYFTCKIYNGFRFGTVGLQEIILSWMLCLFITNALEYLKLSLLFGSLLPATGILAIFAAQAALAALLSCCIDKLYFFLNPAHQAIIIYSSEKKAGDYSEILQKHKNRFEISQIASQERPDEELRGLIDGAESVFFLDVDEKIRDPLTAYCFKNNKRIYILPTFSGVLLNAAEVLIISNTPVFLSKNPFPGVGARAVKRGMDIILSLVGMILLSWLMLIVIIAIRVCDGGPAIYKQTRLTIGGKLFTMYKFRSMRVGAAESGLTEKNDSRITSVGGFIRKTRIDELPQLFNVLLGSMSLVGPRPERPEIAAIYESLYPGFSLRTKVKAGLTCYAHVYGKYSTPPEERLLMDIMYIERASVWQDLMLILQTIKIPFMPSTAEGISKEGG